MRTGDCMTFAFIINQYLGGGALSLLKRVLCVLTIIWRVVPNDDSVFSSLLLQVLVIFLCKSKLSRHLFFLSTLFIYVSIKSGYLLYSM